MNTDVEDYYEKNNSKFKSFGIDTDNKNIHQPLWSKETKSALQASNYSNELILDQIENFSDSKKDISILDLGCGFGATLSFLLTKTPRDKQLNYKGITISQFQAHYCKEKLTETVAITCGDFQSLSKFYSKIDIIYAVESVVHSPDVQSLMKEIKKVLNPGGLFIMIDDFIDSDIDKKSDLSLIKNYKDNWFTHGITTLKEFNSLAKQEGFEEMHSSSLRPLIKQSIKGVLGRFFYQIGYRNSGNMYCKSIIGGAARQNALLKRLLDYRIVVLMKELE